MFISGYKTKYKCLICGVECEEILAIKFQYKHPNNIIFINDYPSSCENNSKILTEHEIEPFEDPIIQTFGGLYSPEILY